MRGGYLADAEELVRLHRHGGEGHVLLRNASRDQLQAAGAEGREMELERDGMEFVAVKRKNASIAGLVSDLWCRYARRR